MTTDTATAADEAPVFVAAPGGDLLGVVTSAPAGVEPNGLAAVLLRGNGWRPSSGPRRTQVALARRLAAHGFTAVRFSYAGVAESGGESSGVFRLDRPHVDDLGAVVAWVREAGLRPVLVGNCFGARTAVAWAADAVTAAGSDAAEAVAGVALLVPPVYDFEVVRRRDRRPLRRLVRRATPRRAWAVLRDRRRRAALARTGSALAQLTTARVRDRNGDDAVWLSRHLVGQLERVLGAGVPVLLVYGDEDPYGADFRSAAEGRLGRVLASGGELVSVVTVQGRVHGLTGVPTQEAVLDAVERWAAGLARPGDGGGGSGG